MGRRDSSVGSFKFGIGQFRDKYREQIDERGSAYSFFGIWKRMQGFPQIMNRF